MIITAEMIPDEVADAIIAIGLYSSRFVAKTDIAAALNAWPEAKLHTVQALDESDEIRYTLKVVGFILPLSQKEPRT